MRMIIRLGLVAALAASMFAAAPASAAMRTGGCGQGSLWKLQAGFDDGRVDGEFEVDQNVRRQRWEVTILSNGRRAFHGVRRTGARSGSFSINFRAANLAGPDRVVAKARNLRTGERCRGAVIARGR